MSRKKLTPFERMQIALLASKQLYTHDELAKQFGCSRRTIQRVLIEQGVLPERQLTSHKERTLLEVLQRHKLTDAKALEQRLQAPPLTSESLQAALQELDYADLAQLFYYVSQNKVRAELEAELEAYGS